MSECPQCGAEVESGSKFCAECGTPIPQTKECPQCHAQLKLAAKFCMECGYSFLAGGGSSKPVIGDKNVIAGDVHVDQSKTIHNTTHNNVTTTNTYINQDETKHLVKCVVCERPVVITGARTCKACHQPVCPEHYDATTGLCTSCLSKKTSEAESAYRKELEIILEDGIVDRDEFDHLETLRKQLGLSAPRAMELQKAMKAELSARRLAAKGAKGDAPLMMVERAQCDRAKELLFNRGKGEEAVKLLESLYKLHPLNEEVLSTYLAALSTCDEARAKTIISSLPVDMVRAYMVLFDIELKRGDLASAEVKLSAAEALWPANMLLKCRRAELMYETAIQTDNRTYLAEAMDLLTSLDKPADKLESSWQFYVQCLIAQALGDEVPSLTPAYCEGNGYYHALVTGQFTGIPVIDQDALCVRCLRDRDFPSGVFASVSKGEFMVLKCAAERGDARAALVIGDCYLDPEGGGIVVSNPEEAFQWYRKSAEGGLADAQFMLGACCENGMGCEIDNASAMEWYEKAASQGLRDAAARIEALQEDDAAADGNEGEDGAEHEAADDGETVDIGKISAAIRSIKDQYDCDDLLFPASGGFEKKWRNFAGAAREKLALHFSKQNAIAFLNCTVFGSGKNGMLVDGTGICILNDWTSSEYNGFISWDDFAAKGAISKNGDCDVQICQNPKIGLSVAGSDLSADAVVELFEGILGALE